MSLKFKGDDGGPAGKKKKKDKKRKREDEEDGVDVEAAPIIAGSGRIVSSGETVGRSEPGRNFRRQEHLFGRADVLNLVGNDSSPAIFFHGGGFNDWGCR